MREKEASCSVIFVRHGATDYQDDRVYKAEDDPPLNDSGLGQGKELARWLGGLSVSAIYVSPTARTRQTAEPIVLELGLKPILRPELRERDFGVWEGLTFDEIASRYTEGYSAWKQNPISYKPEGGESILDLKRRLQAELDRIISQHLHQTVLVVSHVGPIRVAMTCALGMPVEHYRRINVYFGSASRVNYGKRQPNILYMNHLPGGREP
jgi:broad specificity phosphatase PhoE